MGEAISSIINENYNLENKQVTLACSSEDADWLSKGILDNLKTIKLSLAVFWNLRTNLTSTDNEVNAKGKVIPGIGGSVYQRLGLDNSEKKNKYIPQIVKTRREQLSA
ncbi:MAG TPA: hypothetical protein VF939_12425 [Puia sp.]